MSLKSPNAAIERGAYSAIVRKEGDLIIAENDVGTVIEEGSNGATVIQAGIDSCDKMGKVVLTDRFDIDAELTFPTLGYTSFASGITLQGYGNKSGINYTPATGYAIKMQATASNVQSFFHHFDDFLISAPNTTDAAVGILGGVNAKFENMKINNCPSGKGIYADYHATYGNNILTLNDVVMYGCKYGLYAEGGPAIYINGGKFTTGIHSGVPTALEALYYTVDGYTGDGWKILDTIDLELRSRNTDQRSLYIKGDAWLKTIHTNLYLDASPPAYLDSGRHDFRGCLLGKMEWSKGTQITIDQTCRNVWLKTKDPQFGLDELQTPFYIHSNSPFMTTDGTNDVTDASASHGKCIQLDAQNESGILFYHTGSGRMNKYISVGTYLMTIYAKDSNQIANDLKVYAQCSEGGTHYVNTQYYTLTANYNPIPYLFTLESADVGDAVGLYIRKNTTTANTISIDYITLQHIGTNFHQTVGGGHQLLYIPNAVSLPAASASFRGVLAYYYGSAGNTDGVLVCIKKADDTYAWIPGFTG